MKRTKIRSRNGVTLMEVLASMFVISIGLLGVLAVIPFGAFQVAKGRNAEHVSNMLAAAVEDVKIAELTNIKSWKTPTNSPAVFNLLSNAGATVHVRNDNTAVPGNRTLDCMRFLIIDPFDTSNNTPYNTTAQAASNRFHKIGNDFDSRWWEIMRGQDDLVFTVHKDKRTDFSGQGNVVASSGKYTWFMIFAPPDSLGPDLGATTQLDPATLADTVTVDLLGCYNRISDQNTEREVAIDWNNYTKTLQGAQITLRGTQETLDLSKTKYIFVTWRRNSGTSPQFQYHGLWCKVVYAPKNVTNGEKTIVVSNSGLPNSFTNTDDPRALIIDGIMYHKPIPTALTLFDP